MIPREKKGRKRGREEEEKEGMEEGREEGEQSDNLKSMTTGPHLDFSLCLCFLEGEQSDATAMRSSLFTAHAQGTHKTRLKGSLPLSGLIWTQELLGSMPPSLSVQSHMSSAKCYIGHIL